MILVDTNILIDVLTDAPQWAEWSIAALRDQETNQTLAINEVIYAELSAASPAKRKWTRSWPPSA